MFEVVVSNNNVMYLQNPINFRTVISWLSLFALSLSSLAQSTSTVVTPSLASTPEVASGSSQLELAFNSIPENNINSPLKRSAERFFEEIRSDISPRQMIPISHFLKTDPTFLDKLLKYVPAASAEFVAKANEDYCFLILDDQLMSSQRSFAFQVPVESYLRYVFLSGRSVRGLINSDMAQTLQNEILILNSCAPSLVTGTSTTRGYHGSLNLMLRDGRPVLAEEAIIKR